MNMDAWRWFGRAVGIAALLLGVGAVLGATLGAVVPAAAIALGILGVGLVGGAWSSHHVGGAGLLAAFFGIVATVGTTMECRKARVLRGVAIVEVESVDAWPEAFDAVHVDGITQDGKFEASESWKSGNGKQAMHYSLVATPLVSRDRGEVVGFVCRRSGERADSDGAWLIRYALLEEHQAAACAVPIEKSLERLAGADRKVAKAASSRVVRAYASEQALREGADPASAAKIPLALFGLFVVGALLYRKKGALAAQYAPR
jgi:hypothetical protein